MLSDESSRPRGDRRRANRGSATPAAIAIVSSSQSPVCCCRAHGDGWSAISISTSVVLARTTPGAVVAPEILVGFTDNWVFRNCGLHGYGWSPFVLEESEWRRVHGNDERISLENLQAGVRCQVELLLDVAAA